MCSISKYLLCSILIAILYSCSSNPHPFEPCDDYCPCEDGKIPTSNIARWDGSQWISLGSGVNGAVKRIVVDSVANELYVFGDFTKAGDVSTMYQAKWSEKTQSWSALSVQLPPLFPFEQSTAVAVSNESIYFCKLTGISLYNFDSSISFSKKGLYVWNGGSWKVLDKLFEENLDYFIYPYDIRIQGTTLYIFGTNCDGFRLLNSSLYAYDLISNQIVDSIPFSEIISASNSVVYSNTSISAGGIYIDQGDGVYRYNNGNRKKVIQNETKVKWGFSSVSSSSEYVSLWNYYSLFSDDTKQRYMTIYDIKADATYNQYIPLNYKFPVQQVNITYMSGHTLYIGGAFYISENGANVRNIGAFDLQQKKWYDIAGGVCGPVHAITEMNGSIYVGGEFTTAGKK